jgi:uncharacterized coiled-coil protein SlyX
VLNKYQSETENTINREINELSMKIDNMKEEVTHDMENLRKKNETEIQTQWKATAADYNKQMTESQNLKMKCKLKEKLELLLKQLKSCENNMQEFTDSIKIPN